MFDERRALHRYKSTSHAGTACGVMLGVWFLYQHWAKDVFRIDILVIMLVTALIKISFLTYYRLKD